MGKIKTWKEKKVKLVDMKPMPDNARAISDTNLKTLRESLSRFGYVEPIVWNKTTGHIVGGHQRYFVLSSDGVKEATVMVVEMTAEEELAANITLNNPEIQGEWSENAVNLLEQVEGAAPDLYNSFRMDELRKSLEVPVKTDDGKDDKTEKDTKPDTKCPCCGHRWKVGAGDVFVEGSGNDEVEA